MLNDHAGSPVTIIGDGSPRLTPSSPVDVIDLEAPHGSKGFDADDFRTDDEEKMAYAEGIRNAEDNELEVMNMERSLMSVPWGLRVKWS